MSSESSSAHYVYVPTGGRGEGGRGRVFSCAMQGKSSAHCTFSIMQPKGGAVFDGDGPVTNSTTGTCSHSPDSSLHGRSCELGLLTSRICIGRGSADDAASMRGHGGNLSAWADRMMHAAAENPESGII